MDLKCFRDKYLHLVNKMCLSFIEKLDIADTLKEAMKYSYTAGGKRIRPLLLLATIDAFSEDVHKGINTAAALELIHTSSLIHDDLPSMDNDDYRRGKLTNHKVFGEATAILAGDSLLVDSFQLISCDNWLKNDVKVKLVNLLSMCSGANGMIGGQQLDIENETKRKMIEKLMHINYHKTGKLIEFALIGGAIIANQNDKILDTLKKASYHIGIAFQVKDDILDVVGNKTLMGKPNNSDEKNHKTTYVSLLGLEQSNRELLNHYQKALDYITSLGIQESILRNIFQLIVERNK